MSNQYLSKTVSLLLISLFFFPFRGMAQIICKAKVVNSDFEALIGCHVTNLNSDEIVITDIDGNFEINAQAKDLIQISFVGFEKFTSTASQINASEIVLKELPDQGDFIVVTAKHLRPFAFERINSHDIQNIDLANPQNAYNQKVGVFMHAGALNTNRLTIRGIGSRSPFSTIKIKSYLNEIPLTNGIGETNLEDINLGIIDLIDIMKGPTKPSFGSGLGGVIHYNTDRNARKNSLSTSNHYGSFGTIHTNQNYNYVSSENIISLNHDFIKSDGFRDNNDFQRQNISGYGEVQWGKKDKLFVFANHTRVKAEIPSGLNKTDFETKPSAAAFNWQQANGNEDYERTLVGITHQRKFNGGWLTSVTGFTTHFRNDERRPFNILTQFSRSIGTRSFIEKKAKNSNLKIFKIGFEFFNEIEDWNTFETLDIGRGTILSQNFETRKYLNSFLESELKLSNQLFLHSGLNMNLTGYVFEDRFSVNGIDQSGAFDYPAILSPFLSFDYKISPNRNFYATVSHGFSNPTLQETLTPDGLINPDIKQETGWNFEVGTRYTFPGFLSLDASLYYMIVDNLLVSERVSEDVFIGVNAGRTNHPGAELTLFKSFQFNEIYLSFNANHQWSPHTFQTFVNNEVDFSGNFLPGNPEHKSNFLIKLNYKKWDTQLDLLSVGQMFADDANSITVDGYQLINAMLSYDLLNSKTWEIKASFRLNNILDQNYASMVSVNPRSFGGNAPRYLYPGLPRNFQFGLMLAYKFENKMVF